MRIFTLAGFTVFAFFFTSNAIHAESRVRELRVRGGDFFGMGLCHFNASKDDVDKHLKAGWKLVSATPVSFSVQNRSTSETIGCHGTTYILQK